MKGMCKRLRWKCRTSCTWESRGIIEGGVLSRPLASWIHTAYGPFGTCCGGECASWYTRSGKLIQRLLIYTTVLWFDFSEFYVTARSAISVWNWRWRILSKQVTKSRSLDAEKWKWVMIMSGLSAIKFVFVVMYTMNFHTMYVWRQREGRYFFSFSF